jgi:hypothetical protein
MFTIDPFSVLIGYVIGLVLCRSVSSLVFPGEYHETAASSYNRYSEDNE